MQCHDGKFAQFIFSPSCSSVIRISGEVSLLAGISAASVKYQRKEKKSSEREGISLSSSVYRRKGFLVSDEESLICVDKGMSLNVEGIEIGQEEILIVSTEVELTGEFTKFLNIPKFTLFITSRNSFAKRTECYIGVLLTK